MRLLLCRVGWVGTISGVSFLVRGNLSVQRPTALVGIALTIIGVSLLACVRFALPKTKDGGEIKPQPQRPPH
ncbi:hypothetical protein JW848_02500 [Candidatus Bipolaricaulota bacterium]|nr:hypothetical protein [Candidatus Bipolaricaulota bacterium]